MQHLLIVDLFKPSLVLAVDNGLVDRNEHVEEWLVLKLLVNLARCFLGLQLNRRCEVSLDVWHV